MATIVTPLALKTRYPEFTATADATIQMALDEALLVISETQWGSKFTLGMIHKTAHILVSSFQGSLGSITTLDSDLTSAPTGNVRRAETFELVREWSSLGFYADKEESTTRYGISFLKLKSTIFFNRTSCVG